MNERDHVDPELSVLERTVLEVALAADTELNARLREQVEAAVVTTRTPSGVGFMTRLRVPGELTITFVPSRRVM